MIAALAEMGKGVIGDGGAANVAVVVGSGVVEQGLGSGVNLVVAVERKALCFFDSVEIWDRIGH